ncbi:MAG: hypothetical protein B7Z06_03495 [Flavobacteriales bacterium 32-35-8]|nr:MAG: hypothetical protein B7Z06_03495 [Flavobacteriales bacterium 32-35-8]
MDYIIIVTIGLLFIGIGFLLTENNASQLLSGYNTMTKEERKKFNLKDYLPFFRKFHIFLGISIIVISLIIYQFSEKSLVFSLVLYPILAYIYFIWKSSYYQIK